MEVAAGARVGAVIPRIQVAPGLAAATQAVGLAVRTRVGPHRQVVPVLMPQAAEAAVVERLSIEV